MTPRHAGPMVLFLLAGILIGPTTASASACGFRDELALPFEHTQAFTFEEDAGTLWSLTATDDYVRWHATAAPGRGPGTDAIGHSMPMRLSYGNSNASALPTYFTRELPNTGTATSPPIDVPEHSSELVLRFNTKYEIESRDPTRYDQMRIDLSRDDGGSWEPLCTVNPPVAYGGRLSETVCSNGTPEGEYPCLRDAAGHTHPAWEPRTAQIQGPAPDAPMRVRFTFDTIDGRDNEAMGWMIDDIHITYTPPPTPPPPVPVMGAPMLGLLTFTLLAAGTILARRGD